MMEIAGIIIGLSILFTSLNCLSPLIYTYILTGNIESMDELPFLKDVPTTAATVDVIDFINQVCSYRKMCT